VVCEPGNDLTSGNVGTLPFKPPEAHDASGGQFGGMAADVWSLGVTLFQMIYGDLPFYADDPLDLCASVRDDPLVFPSPPPDARLEDLLRRSLAKDPAQRPTAAEVVAHPWLRRPSSTIAVTSEDLTRALRSMLSFRSGGADQASGLREVVGAGEEAAAAVTAATASAATTVVVALATAAGATQTAGAQASPLPALPSLFPSPPPPLPPGTVSVEHAGDDSGGIGEEGQQGPRTSGAGTRTSNSAGSAQPPSAPLLETLPPPLDTFDRAARVRVAIIPRGAAAGRLPAEVAADEQTPRSGEESRPDDGSPMLHARGVASGRW